MIFSKYLIFNTLYDSPLFILHYYLCPDISHMKHIIVLIGVLLLFLLGDRIAGHLMQRQAAASQFRYAKLYSGRAEADILLIGNSRGLTFYQPYIEEKTGLSTCNLSYNGMPMELAATLATDYLERYPAPKVMVIDITLCDRPNDELITAFTTYLSQSTRLDTFLHRKLPKVWWGTQVTHLFRFNNEVFQRALYYRNQSDEDWLLDRVISDRLAAKVDSMKYSMDLNMVPPLVALTSYAQQKGIPVKLVITPYFPGFAKNIDRLDSLKLVAEQRTGLRVYDYRSALPSPNDFGDLQHPNKKGSTKYIDLLIHDEVIPRK